MAVLFTYREKTSPLGDKLHEFQTTEVFDDNLASITQQEAAQLIVDLRQLFGPEETGLGAGTGGRWAYVMWNVTGNLMHFAKKRFTHNSVNFGGYQLRVVMFDEADAMTFKLKYC